jgi:Tfp pilus assembly protein PilX
MQNLANRSKQSGMAVVVSLIMLLLMNLIILQAARSSNLELLLGNNSQHTAEALMAAEDSVVAGETLIETNYTGAPGIDFGKSNTDGLYVAGEIDITSVDWSGYQTQHVGSGDQYREYIIEYLGPVTATGGSISVGAGVASGKRFLYRVSGRGESGRGGARVVQTIYATAE